MAKTLRNIHLIKVSCKPRLFYTLRIGYQSQSGLKVATLACARGVMRFCDWLNLSVDPPDNPRSQRCYASVS